MMDEKMREKIAKMYEELSREELILMIIAAKNHDEEMRPKKVTIDAEEMNRIEEVLRVFGSYIDGHYHFDFLVSKKFGIIRPDVDGHYMYFSNADEVFYRLVDEIFNDVRELQIGGQHMTDAMRKQEEEEVCNRVLPLLDQLQDREHYNEIFQNFLNEYREEEE